MNHHRRATRCSIAIVLLCAVLTPDLRAADKPDPTGAWLLRVTRPGRPVQESTLKLEKAGDQLVGVMTNAEGRSTPVKDAKLKGSELTFRIVISRDGREFNILYSAALTEDTLKGKVSISFLGQTRSSELQGKRLKGEDLLAGLWKISMTLQDGQKLQPTLNLKREGKGWAGSYIGTTGKEMRLTNVNYKDDVLSIQLFDTIEGDLVPLNYAGKLSGNKIDGTVKVGAGKEMVSLKFQAEKVETPTANLSGTWKLKVPFKPEQLFEPVLKLSQTGSGLNGTYHGEHDETAISDALVFGDEFTFEVFRNRDGKRYRLKYQGKASGDTMKGSVEYDFDGVAGFLDFEGKRVSPPGASAKASQ
jgi:hypothetical protein